MRVSRRSFIRTSIVAGAVANSILAKATTSNCTSDIRKIAGNTFMHNTG